jgi:DNA repair protein RecO (recombination protein O)
MTRARQYRTEAIVLTRTDFGEADRIVCLLTPDRGPVRAVARGARRLTSRTGAHLELFRHIHVVLSEGRNLDNVVQADTISAHAGLHDDLVRTTYAYHLAELADRLVRETPEASQVFALMRDAILVLETCADPPLLVRFTELALLDWLGYRPELGACTACRSVLEPAGNSYDAAEGGALCANCAGGRPIALDPTVFKVLRFLQSRPWSEVARLAVTPDTHDGLERIMVATLRHILERDMKSVEFLANLRSVEMPPRRVAEAPPPYAPR